jgi:hypothetical protein
LAFESFMDTLETRLEIGVPETSEQARSLALAAAAAACGSNRVGAVADRRDTRPPRGALAVIAVGLIATVAAALLSTTKPLGAAELDWVRTAPLPDSAPAAIPGGGAMRLTDAAIRVTEANAADYRLYRTAAVLRIDAGSAVGQGQARCRVRIPTRTIVAHTPNRRASYPRPTREGEDNLIEQEVSERVLVRFSSHSTDYAVLELGDAFPTFTDTPGVAASWAEFRVGRQEWIWGLPPGRPSRPLHLGFASVWRTTATPGAKIACTVTTSAGTATVRTQGRVAGPSTSPPSTGT